MRKKSHLSLAKFIMNNIQVENLNEHKKAFYIGSILPDLKPSFLTKRHTIDETFDTLTEEIKKITVDYDISRGMDGYYARHLGVITHYLADYCTFPHNSIFEGTMTEHVHYEKVLKKSLKNYVHSDAARRDRLSSGNGKTMDEILQLIIKTHKEYLKALKVVKRDIEFIVDLCYKVVDALIMFFEIAYAGLFGGKRNNMQIEYLDS
jgi:CRISPR/Cas system-associated endoribonuclease Cas2